MINIDLTNCDREPIHIPGKIQSHGFLLAVDALTYQISFASANVGDYLGLDGAALLDKNISDLNMLLAGDDDFDLKQLLKLGKLQGNFDIINPYKLMIGEVHYYLIIHRSEAHFVLEFEQATLQYDIQNIIGKSISEILSNKNLDGLLSRAAQEIKSMIEYDRIMIYKFKEDGHGEVVAEVKNEDLEPFFGLHYPASDIPKQARELYKLNMTRIIADVNTEASAILAYEEGITLDLTHSTLRAVSPIHIQYLKNMGVASSFSISLLAHGELWGLIACHNYTPKFIDFKAREGTKLIGQILSSALEYRQVEEDNEQNTLLNEAVNELAVYLDRDADVISALTKHEKTLVDMAHSTGVAILFEDRIYTLGSTPEESDLLELFNWLKLTMDESVYHSAKLSAVYRPALKYTDKASGILAAMLSKDMGELIVWFKPEKMQTIHWAGNPDKAMEPAADGTLSLSPRNSFASFAEIVRHTSERWTKTEISGVLKLREKIMTTVNKKANEIRLLNERLKLAYEELDTFSYTISHDLRTPLTSIKSYTEMFLLKNKDLDEQGKKLLGRVMIGADKMGYLIDEILKLARVGRSDVEMVRISMETLIKDIATEVSAAQKASHVQIQVGDCPDIDGDFTLITQVFTNIISNAVKYCAKSVNPKVSIEGVAEADEIIYKITDNGIGIDIKYYDRVFELFKRMENVKDFDGTGVGLAIVKRIIERHNGRIWFESELNVGTVFYLAFKK
ncbi:ATP-binding protein [Pedobacter sp. GR22-6]|uniref:ATP-binding protein n=1 Tax=Pedobacter sp. GR22-6 TaxID=3127957 RepID=UPI00307E0E45